MEFIKALVWMLKQHWPISVTVETQGNTLDILIVRLNHTDSMARKKKQANKKIQQRLMTKQLFKHSI